MSCPATAVSLPPAAAKTPVSVVFEASGAVAMTFLPGVPSDARGPSLPCGSESAARVARADLLSLVAVTVPFFNCSVPTLFFGSFIAA
jgi:hypothetical protein